MARHRDCTLWLVNRKYTVESFHPGKEAKRYPLSMTAAKPACAHTEWLHLPKLRCDTSNLWIQECPTNQEVPETLGPRHLNMQMLIPIVPSDMVSFEKYNDIKGGAFHPDTS